MSETFKTYGVSVESEDIHEAQWNDHLIVLARNGFEAERLALEFVSERRSLNEAEDVSLEVYEFYDNPARVIGRIIDTDEE